MTTSYSKYPMLLSRELPTKWYVLAHGGRYFLNEDLLLTYQRQFSDGFWDGPDIVEDYDENDPDEVAEIDFVKSMLHKKHQEDLKLS